MTSGEGSAHARRARKAIRSSGPVQTNASSPPARDANFGRTESVWDVGVAVDLPVGARDIGYWRLEGHAWSLGDNAPATAAEAWALLGLQPDNLEGLGAPTIDDGQPALQEVVRLVDASGVYLRVRPDRYSAGDLQTALLDCPLPVFGSPPADWKTVTNTIMSGSPVAVGVTTYSATGQPVLAIVTAAAAYLFWFIHPAALVVRDSLRRKVEGRLGEIPPSPARHQSLPPPPRALTSGDVAPEPDVD